jgi:hypothetical protein
MRSGVTIGLSKEESMKMKSEQKKILVEMPHGTSLEETRKFCIDKMKKENMKERIVSLEKNNWLSFTHDSGNYFFDLVIQ